MASPTADSGSAAQPTLELQAALERLVLQARHPAQRPDLGLHPSRQHGQGMEFAQHRPYAPGDALRRIDWPLYARSDRLYIREAETERTLQACVLLDATASMGVPTGVSAWPQRLDAARALARALLGLAARQGDEFACACIGGQSARGSALPAAPTPRWWPPQRGARALHQHTHALESLQAAGSWPEDDGLGACWARLRPGALVLVLSDLLDPHAPLTLSRLARLGFEVRALQVLTHDEVAFPFRDGLELLDPETGARTRTDPSSVRAAYLQAFGAAQQVLQTRLQNDGVRLARWTIGTPLTPALRFLASGRAAS